MKIAHKIVIYSLCLLLTLSWVTASVSNIIKASTEKNIADKKEALPEGKSEVDEKKFEIVYDFLPSFSILFQDVTAPSLHFSKVVTISQSVFLDLTNPPPEFHLFA
ncbi:hypothetical protein [Flavobacterium sp. 5]|uniref:hypothetical protein n=1 Tax=Flavobacterium sp. 5 TaxID=2035199 RepID=UPI0012FE7C90|nr:hypothetical protein [Flavobacterium sp. 5]